jgi:hypothetical protein
MKVVLAQSECHILLFFIRCKRCLLPQLSYLLFLPPDFITYRLFRAVFLHFLTAFAVFFAQFGKVINPGFYDPYSRFPLCGIFDCKSFKLIKLNSIKYLHREFASRKITPSMLFIISHHC